MIAHSKFYITEHFRDTIEDPERWNSPTVMMSIPGRKRVFAEEGLSDSLNPSEAEIRKANAARDPVGKECCNRYEGTSLVSCSGWSWSCPVLCRTACDHGRSHLPPGIDHVNLRGGRGPPRWISRLSLEGSLEKHRHLDFRCRSHCSLWLFLHR